MTAGAITYDEYLYRVNDSQSMSDKGQMQFFWPEAKHFSQPTVVFDLDKNKKRIALEKVKVA